MLRLAAILFIISSCSKQSTEYVSYIPQFDAFKQVSDAADPLRLAANAVVQIDRLATGFFINDSGLLLTNAHVVGPENCGVQGCYHKIRVNHQSGSSSEAHDVFFEPVHVDAKLDFAAYQIRSVDDAGLLGANFENKAFLNLDATARRLDSDTKLYVIGHPSVTLKKISEGEFLATQGSWFTHSAFTIGGNSGSPVVDEYGILVGIAHRSQMGSVSISRTSFTGVSTATTAAAIYASLNPNSTLLVGRDLRNSSSIEMALKDTDSEVSFEQFFENREIYLRSKKIPTFVADDQDAKTIWNLFEGECQQALGLDDQHQADDHAKSLSDSCFSIWSWVNCNKDSRATFSTCPDDSKKILESARLAADKIIALNQASPIWALATLEYSMQEQRTAGEEVVKKIAAEFYDQNNLEIDYKVAALQIWYATRMSDLSFAGTDLIGYVSDFESNIKGPSDYYWLAESVVALERFELDNFTRSDAVAILGKILSSPNVPLWVFLEVEEMAYRSGMVQ